MYYTYVLITENGNYYIGYSSDLRKRVSEHRKGNVFATKNKLPIELVYYEACLNEYDARKRERYLKSGPGHKYLKSRLKNYLK